MMFYVRKMNLETELVINHNVLSPFKIEKTPSARFRYINDALILSCYTTGIAGDCFKVAEVFYRYQYKGPELFYKIHADLLCENIESDFIHYETKHLITSNTEKRSDITFVSRKWNDYDKSYWTQYNISKKILEECNVIPAKRVFYNDVLVREESYKNLIYIYNFYEDKTYQKVYCPLLRKKNKWLSNTPKSLIQGKHLLKENEPKIWTKSYKDTMSLMSYGIMSYSYCSESIIPKEYEMNTTVYYGDNDFPGKRHCIRVKRAFPELPVYINSESQKDFSDFVKFNKENPKKIENKINKYFNFIYG